MRHFTVLCTLLLLALRADAQTSFPMITHVHPVAVQRGQSAEVTVAGQMNFHGVYKALFEGTGIKADIVLGPEAKPAAPKQRPTLRQVKLKLTVAADAPLGVREFRLASVLGISSVGQVVIVDEPVVLEAATNNTPAQAQVLTLPCVVGGKIEADEDVDYFKIEAQAGQTLTFELHCARLQDKIHDLQKHAKPMLTLHDAEGRELAANDHFYFADPLLHYKVAKTGIYYLQIRDSTYDGDPRWVYALLATNKPYASHVYPMAGNPGQKVEVEPIGSAQAVHPRLTLAAPSQLGVGQVQGEVKGQKTNPVTFLVNTLPPVLEQEPNDEPAKATRFSVPAGLNGRMDGKRDLDHFVFKAAKNKALRFEVKARRFGTLLNSSVHAVLEVLDAKGAVVAASEATHGPEAALVFTPPGDADYCLRVRDLNSKGGPSFIYHVEVDWARPDFTLRCDPDKAMLGPGTSTGWYVHVNRLNGFTGPVRVEVKGLPKEVTASPLTIPSTMTQGLMVLTAAPSAALDAGLVEVFGTGTVKTPEGKDETIVRRATPNQEIYSPGGGRARFDVNWFAVAVTEPSDLLKVEVSTTNITLKPGGEAKIDVTILRRPDYDKGVSLDILLEHLGAVFGNPLPPGVTIDQAKSKTLLGNGNKGHIVLKAAPNAAPIDNVPISVLAHVSINFVVKISYSSSPIMVSIR